MLPPCKRDCPDRSPTCHTACEKYKAYQAAVEEARVLRRQEQQATNAYCDGMRRRSGYCPMR